MFLDRADDRWLSAEARADWHPSRVLRLSAGVEGEAHRTTQRAWADDPTVGAGPIEKDFLTLNAYALAEGTVRERLRLHGGVTFYAHELYGSRITPKLAAVFRASPRDVVKALYSHGFRPPTASEAFYEDGTDFLANPDLRPETVVSMELVYERQLGAVASVTASVFRNAYEDLIRFETVPAPGLGHPPRPNQPSDWRQQGLNVDTLRTYGGQLGATLRLPSGVVAWGGLSAQGADGGRPANFPALTASASVSSRWPWRPLTLSLSASAISSRPKDATALLPGARPEVPAAVAGSAAALLEVPGVRGLSVELGVHGIGGSRMVHPVPGDFTPITEIADQPAPLLRAGVRWTP
jgi:outer membrane receptor protein involved in Fe transport